MKKNLVILSLVALSLASCEKKVDSIVAGMTNKSAPMKIGEFVQFTIPKGDQFSDRSTYSATNYQQQSFTVKFDSSAIYQTIIPANQYDINKLFGFSDNNAKHHEYSARFGWRWSDNSLQLFGYVYNNSVMSFKELGTAKIGAETQCSIRVDNDTYIFTLNGKETKMPRESKTATAEGYKLYPYFGGDELAPHLITLWIKEL
ncbi:hypothetical protein [Segetibacter aerophilus]|uniref:Lipoprotein n=1 Tax=Segetibacter aerophilus TaxID=670293 RepID=A0A512BCX0_9BACT|nr:hypothetical protein [Segetibacter aerophilus]GEO09774.1 hypothetical protein SAE01_22700 [Segetibacter aerophilus]